MTTSTAKPRDDQPFDFNLDAVQSEVELRPFRVHWGGKRFELTHLQALDVWSLLEAAEGGDIRAMTAAFREALGDQWGEFRKIRLPQYKLEALFKAYRKHCGMGEGESQASAGS